MLYCKALVRLERIKMEITKKERNHFDLEDFEGVLRFNKYPRTIQKQPPEVFREKGLLRYFAEFIEKHMYRVPFLIKLQALKKRPWYRCFPLNFVKFLRTPFLHNTSGRLLLIQKQSTFYLSSSV